MKPSVAPAAVVDDLLDGIVLRTDDLPVRRGNHLGVQQQLVRRNAAALDQAPQQVVWVRLPGLATGGGRSAAEIGRSSGQSR